MDDPKKPPFDDLDDPDFVLEDDSDYASDLELDDTPLEEDIYIDSEDDEFDSEDWDVEFEDEPVAAEPRSAAQSKSGMSFNTKVMIGAFVVGFGVFIWTVLSNAPAIMGGAGFNSALTMSGATQGPVMGREAEGRENLVDPETRDTGFLNNPERILQQKDAAIEQNLQDVPPMPTPILGIPEQENVQQDAQRLMPMPIIQNQEERVPRSPDAPPALIQTENESPPVIPSAEDILKNVIAQREESKADLQVLSEVKQEEKPSAELAQSETVPLEPASQTPQIVEEESQSEPEILSQNDGVRLSQLSSRIDNIEVRISNMEQATSSKIDDLADVISALREDIADLPKNPAQPAQRPKTAGKAPEVSKTREKPQTENPVKPKRVQKPKPAPATAASWELRAAQPGKAWVSKKGDRNMKSVQVGDRIEGVGQITAISYLSGRWIVQGTNGEIRQ